MKAITNGFVSKGNPRFFMYSVKDLDDDKVTCYCFRTQKKITVSFSNISLVTVHAVTI